MECFTVYSDEIDGRIDPFYYKPKFVEFDKKISKGKFKLKEVKEIAKVICGPFGSSITVKDYKIEGVPLIRISDIDEDHLSKENIIYISKELSEKLKSYIVRKNDLIISQRGTLGLAVKIDEDFDGAVISANFIAIKELKKVFPDFLQVILSSKLGQTQLIRNTSGQVQTKITTDDIKNIRIPILSEKIQNQIVDGIKKAYREKSRKESEAQQLLDSINDYVLEELKLKISEIKEDKCYVISSDKILNNRQDPYYYNPKFGRLLLDIKKSKIKLVPLKEISTELFNGKTPSKEDYAEEGKLILKVNCLKHNKVVWDKLSFVKDAIPLVKTVKNNDILLLSSAHQSDYLGKNPSIVEMPDNLKDKKIFFVGELINIRPNTEKINPYYLLAILKLNEYYFLVNREKRGQTSHLYPEDLGNVKIPLPSLAIQNKIAEEVKTRIKKTEQLQKEAEEIVEKAKQEVEKMILG